MATATRKKRPTKAKAKAGGMTKRELRIAQFLLRTARTAHDLADEVDPGRMRGVLIEHQFDGLVARAGYTFAMLTGRAWSLTDETDLNTESPAAWTREPLLSRRVLTTKDGAR